MSFSYKYFPNIKIACACVLCGSRDWEPLVEANYPVRKNLEPYTIKTIIDAACKTCGLIQRVPMPTVIDLEAFYSGSSEITFDLTSENKYEGDTLSDKIKKDQFDYLVKHLDEISITTVVRNIVEIGTFDGAFLMNAKNAGFNISGFEPSAHCATASKRLGCQLKNEFFSEGSKFAITPDVIVALHVLEHVSDPVIFLKNIKTVSASAGNLNPVLFLEVPNVLAFPTNDLAPFSNYEHTFNYSARTLTMVIEQSGFSVHIIDEYRDRPILRCIARVNKFVSAAPQISTAKQELEFIVSKLKLCSNSLTMLAERVANIITKIAASNQKILLYGAGIHTARLLDLQPSLGEHVAGVIDSDHAKWGSIVGGFSVISPECLKAMNFPILISSYAYQEDIYHYIIKNWPDREIFRLYDHVVSHENF